MPEITFETNARLPEPELIQPDLYVIPEIPEIEKAAATATVYDLGRAALQRHNGHSVNELDAEEQLSPHEDIGYMTRYNPPVPVVRTLENADFFSIDKVTGKHKLTYQHSAFIVGLLEGCKAMRTQNPERQRPEQGALAFHDVNGNFYNHLHIQDLHPESNGENGELGTDKHTAVFESYQDGDPSQFSIPIDEIYCLSNAKHPFVWEGDDS
jgi:hypothetical protein